MAAAVLEPVIGAVNGSNRDFRTASQYVPGTLVVFLNGLALAADTDDGWIELGGNRFRMKTAPFAADAVQVYYRPA